MTWHFLHAFAIGTFSLSRPGEGNTMSTVKRSLPFAPQHGEKSLPRT